VEGGFWVIDFSTTSPMRIMTLLGDRVGDPLHTRKEKNRNISNFGRDIGVLSLASYKENVLDIIGE